MDERTKRINELLNQEKFLNELKQAENDEEVRKLFAKNNVELSLDEIEQMVEQSIKAHEMEESSELNEEELDNVSGGSAITLAVGCVAFFASYGYRRYIKKR